MGAETELPLSAPAYRVDELGIGMSPVETPQRRVVAALKTQLDPQMCALGVPRQEIEDRIRHAIRTSADRQSHHARMLQRLIVGGSEMLDRTIRIAERLEIDDELLPLEAILIEPDAVLNLLIERDARDTGID